MVGKWLIPPLLTHKVKLPVLACSFMCLLNPLVCFNSGGSDANASWFMSLLLPVFQKQDMFLWKLSNLKVQVLNVSSIDSCAQFYLCLLSTKIGA